MAFISVTYSFSNGATADATQVNQDLTDIINGTSDTTKDFSINNLTTAGTLTSNGNTVIGASSSKTLTVNASLASSILLNANTTYYIGGATLGLQGVYIGGTSTFTTCIKSAATASWTLNLPTTAGSNLQVLQTDGSGNTSWQTVYTDPTARQNYGISSSVGSSALTINLIGANGSTASATNPVNINFRSATSSNGTPVFVQCTGSLSLIVPSGATIGTANSVSSFLYLYAVNNAGTIELAVAGANGLFDEGTIQNTTNLTSGSSSAQVLYGTVGRTGVAVRLLGRLKVNESTAGTWASNASEITAGTLYPPTLFFASSQVTTQSSANTSTSFATYSNSPSFIFTPTITGTYKIYSLAAAEEGDTGQTGILRVFNTSGSATLLYENQGVIEVGPTNIIVQTTVVQSVYTLTAGTAYQFDIQGKTSGGATGTYLRGDLASFYMFAEFVGVR